VIAATATEPSAAMAVACQGNSFDRLGADMPTVREDALKGAVLGALVLLGASLLVALVHWLLI
jgi:hypothetical protein